MKNSFLFLLLFSVIFINNIYCQVDQVLIKTPFCNNAKLGTEDIYHDINTSIWGEDGIEHSVKLYLYTGGIYLMDNTGSITKYYEKNNYIDNFEQLSMYISGNDIFVGTTTGMYKGIYNSSTDYVSWEDAEQYDFNWDDIDVYSIYTNLDLWFVCTNRGLYRSEDGGDTWDSTFVGSNRKTINCVIPVVLNYFIATSNGIYKTTDSGDNWTLIASITSSTETLHYNSSMDTIYAGLTGGRYIKASGDRGNSWRNIDLANNNIYDFVVRSITTEATNSNFVFIGTLTNGFLVYNTTNNTLSSHNNNINKYQNYIYPVFNDLIVFEGDLYAATGKYGPYHTYGDGLYKISLPVSGNWSPINVFEETQVGIEKDLKMLYIYNSNLWILSYGGSKYLSASVVESAYLPSQNGQYSNPDDPPYWPRYNCHCFAWHYQEGGENGYAIHNPLNTGYIKFNDQYNQNWDYIIAGYINHSNTIVENDDIDKNDLLNGNWEKSTIWNMNHSSIKSFLSSYPEIPTDSSPFPFEDIKVISKWSNNGPLVEHNLFDNPWGFTEIKFWKSNKTVSGTIASSQFIGRQLFTDGVTTIEDDQTCYELYVAPMTDHKIVFYPGFKAESGSCLRAYVKTDCTKPWEEYRTAKIGILDDDIKSSMNTQKIVEIKIEVSPNPSSNRARVTAKIDDFDNNIPIRLDIYSFSGKIVKSVIVTNGIESFIDLDEFASGAYMLAAESEYTSKNGNLISTAGSEVIIVEK